MAMKRMALTLSGFFPTLILCFLRLRSVIAFVPTSSSVSLRLDEQHQLLHLAVDSSSLLSECSASYAYCLDNYYFQTQSATGALCSSMGDAIAQATERKSADESRDYSYDFRRGMTYFAKGIGGGIMWACWFDIADTWSIKLTNDVLSELLGIQEPSFALEQTTRTAISILLEQFLVCPLLFTFWDIPLPALLRGSPPRQIPAQIQNKLIPLLIAYAKVWTPVNLITYNIPVELRVLFASLADIVWQSMDAAITSQAILVDDPSGDLSLGHQASFSTIVNGTEASSAATTMAEEVIFANRT